MKKSSKVFFSLMVIMALYMSIGCPLATKAKNDSQTVQPEFSGTWLYTLTGLGSGTDKFILSGSSLVQNSNYSITNPIGGGTTNFTGIITATINSYDVTSKRIFATITSATGMYNTMNVPGYLYFNYSITGNNLYWNYSQTAYQTTTPNGPYTKQ